MSTRAEELARRVERGAAELIAAVEGLSEAAWTTICPKGLLRKVDSLFMAGYTLVSTEQPTVEPSPSRSGGSS